MLEVLDYLIRPSIYRTRLTHCVSIKSLVLGLIGLKLSRFQVPKFLAECFIIMYAVCLLFYAIGGFLFVTRFVLNRPNVVDTIFIVLHPERDDLFYSLSIILLLIS